MPSGAKVRAAEHEVEVVARTDRQAARLVAADAAADHDTRAGRELAEHRIEYAAADIVEDHVRAVRALCPNLVRKIRGAIVDRGVEACFLDKPSGFFRAAGDPHRASAGNAGELAHDRSGRPGGPRNQHGVTGLGMPALEQAAPGGEAGCAQDGENGRGRQRGIDFLDPGAVRQVIFGPARRADYLVAWREAGVAAFDHLADRAAAHDIADRHGRDVISDIFHPALLSRIEAEIARGEQQFAVGGGGDLSRREAKVIRLDRTAARMRVEKPLARRRHGQAFQWKSAGPSLSADKGATPKSDRPRPEAEAMPKVA